MVALEQIRSSNSKIATAFLPGLVAVFAGATNGVGETSLKQFAKNAVRPRICFLGRSRQSRDRVQKELQELNPKGECYFTSVDVSLLHSVDRVCGEIRAKETAINLLFLSTGHRRGPQLPIAVALYARLRFIANLLPLGRNISFLAPKGRAQFSSMMTLALEAIAQTAPTVSFIHAYPGFVKTNFGNDVEGVTFAVLRAIWEAVFPTIVRFLAIPIGEAGERHLFLATSARFPGAAATAGVPLPQGVTVARGTNGRSGSGVYSVSNDGEGASATVEKFLSSLGDEGTVRDIWAHVEEEFVRITGATTV
ncbi:hypothetical protein B0H67DRAFT_684418 [Lasiosphaeris hirsuta]|uniref:Short-chain dehydrogenase/reductase n=1 Tax=Lasiosphaeris hirsuta TaxID=260670 RepID=A0AA40A7F5_9PEZI|nr:hypothetical protein B0H67DRAFT_684418 [Lasiosphaeris hirsuta]